MPRIAKADVHRALERAAAHIVEAGGRDGRISRQDIQRKLAQLEGSERALVDVFYRFIDHRDSAPGAVVTRRDVDTALTYAKDTLVDRYDLNRNGLSKDEIAQMSEIGQQAVTLARALMGAAAVEPTDPRAAVTALLEDLHQAVEAEDLDALMGCLAAGAWEALDDGCARPMSLDQVRDHFARMFATLRDLRHDGLVTGDGFGGPFRIDGDGAAARARVNDFTPLRATIDDVAGGYSYIGDPDFGLAAGDPWYEERSEGWPVLDVRRVDGRWQVVAFGLGSQ